MDTSNPLNLTSKERRKLLNHRNSSVSRPTSFSKSRKRDSDKEKLIDLSKKDNRSGRGHYI